MTLSALIRKRETGNPATAIPAIPATHGRDERATVAKIATVAVAISEKGEATFPAIVSTCGAALSSDQPFYIGEKTVMPQEQPEISGEEPAAAIPAITGKEQKAATVFTEGKQQFDPEAWAERAAICEFDGELSREEAEAIAWQEDDRRRCCHCLNLLPNGICKVASPQGPVVANRGYRPVDILKRCEGYRPCPDDPDRRNGLERWPGLIKKGDE